MKWRALIVMIGVLLSASAVSADDDDDRYLNGMTHGPYRGRVIDADTKAPLEGAVVLAVWRHVKVYPLHSSTVLYAAREAVTNGDGRFVVDAKTIEESAPRRTLPPKFVVYLPGYAAYGVLAFPERVLRTGEFVGDGATIGLARLRAPDERLRQQDFTDPYSFSDDPFKELPFFSDAFNRDRVQLQLRPLPRERRD